MSEKAPVPIGHRPRRPWAAVSFFSLLALAVGTSLIWRWLGEAEALRWLAGAALSTAYVGSIFWRWTPLHRSPTGEPIPRLGPGTIASLVRGLTSAWLVGLGATRASAMDLGWAPSAMVLLTAVLDHLDGRLARATGTASEMGRRVDLDLDGFTTLTAYALAVHLGVLPPIFLIIGALRYLYLLGVWALGQLGISPRPVPPSTARRVIASLQSGFVVGVLLPISGSPSSVVAAGVIAAALLASFGRDTLVVSGAVDVGSDGYRRIVAGMRLILLRALPVGLRVALAGALAWEWIGDPNGGVTEPVAVGLQAILIVAVACLALGMAARTAALGVVVLYLWRISELGPTPERLWVFGAACAVVVLGSGAWSLASPESRIFRYEG
ncbi:MAG: CDP-alcohol phosphatidyltransferase family protein [Anaerolineales bacterium]